MCVTDLRLNIIILCLNPTDYKIKKQDQVEVKLLFFKAYTL